MKKTHKQHALEWMRKHPTLSPVQSIMQWNDTRLASTIGKLKKDGYDIENTTKDGTIAKYKLNE